MSFIDLNETIGYHDSIQALLLQADVMWNVSLAYIALRHGKVITSVQEYGM